MSYSWRAKTAGTTIIERQDIILIYERIRERESEISISQTAMPTVTAGVTPITSKIYSDARVAINEVDNQNYCRSHDEADHFGHMSGDKRSENSGEHSTHNETRNGSRLIAHLNSANQWNYITDDDSNNGTHHTTNRVGHDFSNHTGYDYGQYGGDNSTNNGEDNGTNNGEHYSGEDMFVT